MKSYYTESAELMDYALERIRKESEANTESMQGF